MPHGLRLQTIHTREAMTDHPSTSPSLAVPDEEPTLDGEAGELAEARATIRRLNRRCQSAEKERLEAELRDFQFVRTVSRQYDASQSARPAFKDDAMPCASCKKHTR